MVEAAAANGWIDGDAVAARAPRPRSSAPAPTSSSPTAARASSPKPLPVSERELPAAPVRPGPRSSPAGSTRRCGPSPRSAATPYFVARGDGRLPRRRRRAALPRLRAVLGRVDPRPRPPGGRRGGRRRAAAAGTTFGAPTAARSSSPRPSRRGRRRSRGAAGLVGHRGGDDRGPARPRRDRPGQDRQVRRLLPRPRRRAARRRRAAASRRSGSPARPASPPGPSPTRSSSPTTTTRARRVLRRTAPTRRACSSSRSPPTWASSRPRPGFLDGLRRRCDAIGRAPRLRRGDHRLPRRRRRRRRAASASRPTSRSSAR